MTHICDCHFRLCSIGTQHFSSAIQEEIQPDCPSPGASKSATLWAVLFGTKPNQGWPHDLWCLVQKENVEAFLEIITDLKIAQGEH